MNAKRRHINADEPLWLVVQQAERSKCFEFSPSNRRAIIIGSAKTADIQVNDAAPIAGFLERDETSLWFIPADPNADIRLDTIKVSEKCRIYSHGLLELAGVELRLKVRDTPPTLRGDGLVRIDSEICQPRFSRGKAVANEFASTTAIDASALHAALGQETATTRSFERNVPAGLGFSTKTVEMGPIDFDGWFDEAIRPETQPAEPSGETTLEATPITPIVACGPDVGETPTTHADERSSFRTHELSVLGPLPKCQVIDVSAHVPALTSGEGTDVAADATRQVNESAPVPANSGITRQNHSTPAQRLDPYQTIEISRARFTGPSTSAALRTAGADRPLFAGPNQIGAITSSGDTTEFEVPIGKAPQARPDNDDGIDRRFATSSLSSGPARVDVEGSLDFRPASPVPVEHRPLPLTSADFERAARAAEGHLRKRPSPAEVLAKLGMLAKQRPVLVIGGAAVGSLVLVMLLLGTAHLMGLRANQNTNSLRSAGISTTASVARPATTPQSGSSSGASEGIRIQKLPGDSAVATAGTDVPGANTVPDAIAAPPDVAAAVGHLFSGRLPEAEQSYRDLASRYPNDRAFQAATRMLALRNSPACRPGKTITISCPTVKL